MKKRYNKATPSMAFPMRRRWARPPARVGLVQAQNHQVDGPLKNVTLLTSFSPHLGLPKFLDAVDSRSMLMPWMEI